MQPLMLNPEQTDCFAPQLKEIYNALNDRAPHRGTLGRGVWIGVTANSASVGSAVALPYTQCIEKSGGIPVIIPITDNVEQLSMLLDGIDALVITGGGDEDPSYYNQSPSQHLGEVSPLRDRYDHLLIALALHKNIPMLGICRGMQVINVALGGSLYQDIYTDHSKGAQLMGHNPPIDSAYPCHPVTIESESKLAEILLPLYGNERKEIRVNSIHHQAVDRIAEGATIAAISPDGLVEALELYPHKPVLAVQWHPERLAAGQDDRQLALFRHLVTEGCLYRRARNIHQRTLTIDSHVDTPMKLLGKQCDLSHRCNTLVDYPKMVDGGIDSVCMVAYLPQGELTEPAYKEAKGQLYRTLDLIREQETLHPNCFSICTSPREIIQAQEKGLKAIIPAIENAYPLGTDCSDLTLLRKEYGVSYITLCHNGDNQFCDSARHSCRLHGGVSRLGYCLLDEMQRQGIMIDVSHAAYTTVEQVLDYVHVPIIASHSSAYAVCSHERNLPDYLIQRIAEGGGVIQICLYAGFVHPDAEKASVQHAADHIDHIVRLTGIESVGIGSDFDGNGMLLGCAGSDDLINLTVELLRRGYTDEQLKLIWGGNLLRVMKAVQDHSQH